VAHRYSDVESDEEGMETMETLDKNRTWLLKKKAFSGFIIA
jgi:hypothetical protein